MSGRTNHGLVALPVPYYTLLIEAYRGAAQLGLSFHDADDYASSFILKCLQLGTAHPVAYLIQSGKNVGLDFLRRERRRRKTEVSWECEDTNDYETTLSGVSHTQSPEVYIISGELHLVVNDASKNLTPDQQTVWQLFANGYSAQEIAAFTKRSPQSIRQALFTIRKRLREILFRRGLSQQRLHEYIS